MSTNEERNTDRTNRDDDERQPSVTIAVFGYWIVPILLIAICTRFKIDNGPAIRPTEPRPISLNLQDMNPKSPSTKPSFSFNDEKDDDRRSRRAPSGMPSFLSDKPTDYQEVVKAIGKRRLDWSSTSAEPVKEYSKPQKAQSSTKSEGDSSTSKKSKGKDPPKGASKDPVRMAMLEKIGELRKDYQSNPTNIYKTIDLAENLRLYDVQYHDGGTAQKEAIETYQKAIAMVSEKRQKLIDEGEETNVSLSGTRDANEEVVLDFTARSVDGLLCHLYTALGKTYFMANMFEKAVESYTRALEIAPTYLDAMAARGSSRIILGQFEEAGRDLWTVMEEDDKKRYQDVFTGLARILQAKESAIPQGWEPMVARLQEMIIMLESQYESVNDDGKHVIANALNRFYHALFMYHDSKTNDTDAAWENLRKSYKYKMSTIPPWNKGFEAQKIGATKQIFHRGFFPEGVGSQSKVPIFVIGFVRSGSTLLERVLDAHPRIVGTGENSVFNGQLDNIRNKLVETSMIGDASKLKNVIESLADGVVDEMRNRWKMVAAAENRAADREEPERLVDKMLTNYYNVGFIHMLFPNALILHVAREPMDTIFSAYKHEFPPGSLDYTSDFEGLAEMYHAYRDLMEHWDNELPGRVTHIRYEDMVRDMPGVARKIIEVTGLEWDETVLDFHKKKQAVNTLSTTQVRKGVYTDSLQAWRKYEKHLKPLTDMIGDRTKYDLRTTLRGYQPPQQSSIDENTKEEVVEESSRIPGEEL